MPRRRSSATRGSDGRVHDALDLVGDHGGHRRVGAHAAGVGAGVAVADALEVLGRDERHGVRPVAEDEQRALLALHPLLDDDVAPGVAEGGARQLGADVLAGLVEACGPPARPCRAARPSVLMTQGPGSVSR